MQFRPMDHASLTLQQESLSPRYRKLNEIILFDSSFERMTLTFCESSADSCRIFRLLPQEM